MVPKHGSVTSRELDPSCLHLKARTEGRCRPKARQPCGLNCSQHSMESNTTRINMNHVIKVATRKMKHHEASTGLHMAPRSTGHCLCFGPGSLGLPFWTSKTPSAAEATGCFPSTARQKSSCEENCLSEEGWIPH